MGKFRKMLAGVLSAAMVLSTMTVTAFAADTKMPTINDTTKTGSITIHKYEYNENSENHATGEEDRPQLPEGATPLQGAGFTIYKVADVNDLTKYYKANPESLPSVDEYLIDGKKLMIQKILGKKYQKLKQIKTVLQSLTILLLVSM